MTIVKRHGIIGFLIVVSLVFACSSSSSAPVVVAKGPVHIGPTGVVLTRPGGFLAPGPRDELTIELPSGYHLARNSLSDLRGPADESILVRAFLIDSSGARRDLGRQGYLIGEEVTLVFAMDTNSLPGRRWARIELSANVPFRPKRVLFWSGNPGSRCLLCI